MKKKPKLFSLLYSLSALVTAFFLSWLLLAQVNFLYGFWHDQVGIGEGIDHYGPLNRYKQGFAETSREERIRLFAAINDAVHSGGEGLAEIHYHSDSLDEPRPLLRPPEILHLQDVARLIDVFKWLSALGLIGWLASVFWAMHRGTPLPRLRSQVLGIVAFLLALGLVVLLIGPVKVFYQLHLWVFPEDHPWFFYYEDSLMSTLMMAPRVFGWIAAVWIPLGALLFVALQWSAAALQHKAAAGKKHE